ncbi:MAG: ComEA family DNA-binding protein [Deltaproteobacteria bacterium]|nr:ComEA family DNA-binding protein [Deltaproteobacteria bacterium]
MTKKKICALLCVVSLLLAVVSLCAAEEGKININIASVEELSKINGVGAKLAQRIIDYRSTNGLFTKTEDIMKVKGIGQKLFDANKDRIVVK